MGAKNLSTANLVNTVLVTASLGISHEEVLNLKQRGAIIEDVAVSFTKVSETSLRYYDNYSHTIPINIENINFNSFERNPNIDIVCVTPIRTIVRPQEEIVLIRKVRKVEEIESSLTCPANTRELHMPDDEIKVDVIS